MSHESSTERKLERWQPESTLFFRYWTSRAQHSLSSTSGVSGGVCMAKGKAQVHSPSVPSERILRGTAHTDHVSSKTPPGITASGFTSGCIMGVYSPRERACFAQT